jgi:hypothetical protein
VHRRRRLPLRLRLGRAEPLLGLRGAPDVANPNKTTHIAAVPIARHSKRVRSTPTSTA